MTRPILKSRALFAAGWCALAACSVAPQGTAGSTRQAESLGAVSTALSDPGFGVAPQYSSTHVYVAPSDVDAFVQSFLATFGGQSTTPVLTTVTPTPSTTTSQILQTPAGLVSIFGYTTPIPYPFGSERTGYLVTNLDVAAHEAQSSGADVAVQPYDDPIGRDAIVRWPGGVEMQLYWHTTPPSYPSLQTVPENRVYVSFGRVDAFVQSFVAFSRGTLTSDDPHAPGIEIGRPGDTVHRVEVTSAFGKVVAFATDGHLPFPYGREVTGYEVDDLTGTLANATATGATVLVAPYSFSHRQAAMVEFPGGYIAEIHAIAR
jgi:hypothetical protein